MMILIGAITNIIISFLCALAVVLCAWKVVNFLWLTPKRLEKQLMQQGLKGNEYRFLHGDMRELAMMLRKAKAKPISLNDNGAVLPRVRPFQHHALQKHGKNFIMWMGSKPKIYIVDPKFNKDIFMKLNDFHKMRLNPPRKLLSLGLVHYEGDQWVKHRKLLTPAFHVENLKNMLPAFRLSCVSMVEKWEKLVSATGSCELDVWSDIQTLTNNTISRTAFGSSNEEGIRISKLLKDQAKILLQTFSSVYIPGTWYLPTKRNMRLREIDKEIRLSLKSIIDKRMKAIKSGEGNQDDLLGILLQSNMKEVDQHGKKSHGMTINEVIDECKLFYIAGQESTASALVWTMVLLSKHQEWQLRAREEVFNVLGNKNLDLDALNHLKVVTMILHEVLRLYPPIVDLVRETYADITLEGLFLPAGTLIGLPIILLHYDEEIWGEDAKEFKPERFSEGVSKATKNKAAYFPFGWGPRICIGQNFAMLELKIALSMILQNFSFELSPSYVHAPRTILTLEPQFGAHLILHKL